MMWNVLNEFKTNIFDYNDEKVAHRYHSVHAFFIKIKI